MLLLAQCLLLPETLYPRAAVVLAAGGQVDALAIPRTRQLGYFVSLRMRNMHDRSNKIESAQGTWCSPSQALAYSNSIPLSVEISYHCHQRLSVLLSAVLVDL